jgi:YfiH family protein
VTQVGVKAKMIRREVDSLAFYQFGALDLTGLMHAIFTRRGGVSPAPWASLNLSISCGDTWERVAKNRELAFSAVDWAVESRFDVWQIHSAKVVVARKPRGRRPMRQADAIITDTPGVALFMRYADCAPILFLDPIRRAIGLAHAGWLGTLRQVAPRTVQGMRRAFGSAPSDLITCIGPSIGAHHYPVGPEVVARVRQLFGSRANQHLSFPDGQAHFDLGSANEMLLGDLGVTQIERSEICTACHLDDWYSHRGEGGKTGRFGAIFALRP